MYEVALNSGLHKNVERNSRRFQWKMHGSFSEGVQDIQIFHEAFYTSSKMLIIYHKDIFYASRMCVVLRKGNLHFRGFCEFGLCQKLVFIVSFCLLTNDGRVFLVDTSETLRHFNHLCL
jgi:hypothetical protein